MTKRNDTIEQSAASLETAGGVDSLTSGTVFDSAPTMKTAPAGEPRSLGSPTIGGASALSTITGTNGSELIVGTITGALIKKRKELGALDVGISDMSGPAGPRVT